MLPEEGVIDQYTTLTEVIRAYWPILVCSFGVSLLATPLCRRYALHRGIVDRPDDWLKPHKKPTPYLGGVAVFLGWAAGIVLALVLFDRLSDTEATDLAKGPRDGPVVDPVTMGSILLSGLAITLLGLFDDLRKVSPRVKLAAQLAVAFWLILIGVGDETILIVLRSTELHGHSVERWLVLACSVPLTLLITLGTCNATNQIDGLDGLCSGVLGIVAAGLLVIAVHLHLRGNWHTWDAQRVVLALAMMGAALGFLPYNRSPARIFMGDAGSMVLGLSAAVLLLLSAESASVNWFLGSVLVFGLPLADMVLTLVRRWRCQRPLMEGDRSHYYDQLVDRGLPVRRVVRISYGLAAFFALVGYFSTKLWAWHIILIYLLLVLAVAAVVKKLKMVRVDARQTERQ